MKKVLGIVSFALLAGCASTNYSEINDSQAVISNLTVSEQGKAGTDKHQLDVKFDYSIQDYKDISGLYTCSVLFASSEGTLITTTKEKAPCKIDSESGSVAIKWDTPFSTSARYSPAELNTMQVPLKYLVAIHQNKTSNTNVIIGMSEPLYLTPEI
ncbi:hypothetical protein [Arsukibacterium sp.]|uniref:hypothetical protein n=1 Tax=Arsukibacterium sp. TaxID=1977258 RepID=UPI00299F1325|nr:hypothetical protein [Arsukibacterium sp.]MDX1539102.1 hypothetical protein [Arsukibacterium sp.]